MTAELPAGAATDQEAILREVRLLRDEHAASTRMLTAEIQALKAQLESQSCSAAVTAATPAGAARQRTKNALVRDPFFAAALRRAHPMFVVKVTTLLAPSFQRFRSHEELKAAGMLVEWREGMGAVLFCSHTWLRRAHPDSEAGDKFAMLTGLLRKIQAGQLDVHPNWLMAMLMPDAKKRLRLKAAELQRDLVDGYVFFDYMSIPQADPEAQQRAVVSLGSYVSASSYFFVLAGPWVHENGSIRDDAAWEQRGWCRMELVANALSPTPKPMVLAKSIGSVEANAPGGRMGRDWLTYALVGKGAFTVEADRAKLGAHLLEIIAARKALALADKDMVFYRMLHALTPYLLQGTGLAPADEPLDAWMSTMRFESVRDEASRTGLTPLLLAVMAGRVDLAEALIAQGADVNATVRIRNAHLSIIKGSVALQYTGHLSHGAASGHMARLLLRAGANPRLRIPGVGATSLMVASYSGNCEAIEAHLDHDASLIEERSGFGDPEYFACVQAAAGTQALDMMCERFREQMPRWVEAVRTDAFGCGLACYATTTGTAETLVAMLDVLKVPVNVVGKARGTKVKLLLGALRVVHAVQRRHVVNLPMIMSLGTETTALHAAAILGKLGHLIVLLERGAEVDSTSHPMRMTPLILASLMGHEGICKRLLAAGASPGVKDGKRRTALDWAKRNAHEEVAQLLLSALRLSGAENGASSSLGQTHDKALASGGRALVPRMVETPKPPAQVAPNPREAGIQAGVAVEDLVP